MIDDGKGRLQLIRAWAPVVVWVIIVFALGTTPGLFQKYHALLKPLLQPSRSPTRDTPRPAAPPSTGPAAKPVEPSRPPTIVSALRSIGRSIWLRLRPLAARILLSAAIMEKVGHFLIYLVLGALTGRAHYLAPVSSGFVPLLGAAATLAALDETLQRWVPLRSSSVDDWMVDFAGISVGLALYEIVKTARKALAHK